jgi:predicted nucleotide-binding protein (sugar kinase/HSP70/actin superfamily)
MSTRIGILRTLMFYPFQPFWEAFFRHLGFTTVLSPQMDAETFDRERRLFVGDICLPIESAFSHFDLVRDQADVVFLPKANRIHRDVYVCPTCAGLPYMIRAMAPDPDRLLLLHLTPFRFLDPEDLGSLRRLGCSRRAVRDAHAAAVTAYQAFADSARHEPRLERAIAAATGQSPTAPTPGEPAPASGTGPHLLVLGMPYVLGDRFVNHDIFGLLARRDCRVTTPFTVAPDVINKELVVGGYSLYWTLAGTSLAAMTRRLPAGGIDGVLYCSSFACGVDSVLAPLVQSACRRCYHIPFCHLAFDEHSEVSHLEVRVDAFLECLHAARPPPQPGLSYVGGGGQPEAGVAPESVGATACPRPAPTKEPLS